jgi:hypothetical protein
MSMTVSRSVNPPVRWTASFHGTEELWFRSRQGRPPARGRRWDQAGPIDAGGAYGSLLISRFPLRRIIPEADIGSLAAGGAAGTAVRVRSQEHRVKGTDVSLLRDFNRVMDLDAAAAHGTLNFRRHSQSSSVSRRLFPAPWTRGTKSFLFRFSMFDAVPLCMKKDILTATLPFTDASDAFELAGDRSRSVKVQLAF